ncbi:MAG TPA: DUF3592 domain-containing protein [Chthoniobacteraceae bacterium]|nr:DUF3592 domain-containing protein [Chthoniobacteraceae bacterium]
MTLKLKAFLWLLCALVIFVVLAGLSGFDWELNCKIALHESEAKGMVASFTPRGPVVIRYTFQVNGITYNGEVSSTPENVDPSKFAISPGVTVFYDSHDPSKSVLEEPVAALRNMALTTAFECMLAWSSLFIYWWIYGKKWLKIRESLIQTGRLPRRL